MESDSCDDSQSDSGVSADFSPCSTLEGNTTMSTGNPGTVPKETPIEREIRRAVEREHSLRRSRGLPNLPTSPEYVEIPLRKTVLCQSLTTERCQGKDRQFAGKKMEHDIHEEARREQDLVKLGKVPGFYDKGTVRQLKERKQLFEAFQKPSDSTLTVSTRCKTTSWSSARGSTSSTPRGPGVSEGTGRQVTILEDNLSEAPKENPFYKLRSSTNLVKVEQDIREAQEREKELRKQRISLYGGTGGATGGERGGGRRSSPPTPAVLYSLYNQVLLSPRTPRQKTPLVQRWESGLLNGHNEDDN
uniref:Uncharacterized LOC111650948 n=1 Tax=Seriola lalandi dorsalis TaxID=1841481 RepID=A0A3B4XT19_SERLL